MESILPRTLKRNSKVLGGMGGIYVKFKWKEMRLRDVLTVVAEIATILSLILAWVMYKEGQAANSSNAQAISSSPLLIGFVVVNAMMSVFLFVTISKSLFIYFSGKQYQLKRKFEAYAESKSQYIFSLHSQSENEANALISRTRTAIRNLDDRRAFDEDIYYMILFSLFNSADGDINVVSILDDNEWVDTPEEDEFLRVNLALSEQKRHLNRIFVIDESEVSTKLSNASIKSFLDADHSYIHLFVVFRNKLSRSIINDIGSGFIEFYRFVVACDIFADNEIRGTLVTDSAEVEHYNKIYMQLTEFYQPINQEFRDKYLLHI